MTCERSERTAKRNMTEIELKVDIMTCFFAISEEKDEWNSIFMMKQNKLNMCTTDYSLFNTNT